MFRPLDVNIPNPLLDKDCPFVTVDLIPFLSLQALIAAPTSHLTLAIS